MREPVAFALSDVRWEELARAHWERAPAVLRRPFARPLLTAAEAFALLRSASDRFRAGTRPGLLRVSSGDARIMAGVERYLPDAGDRGLGAYARRVRRALDRPSFEVIANQFQAESPVLWRRLCDFCRGLYRAVGLPVGRAEATLFLGDNPRTSFGIHTDPAGVFAFVLAGRKRLRVWPPDAFQGVLPDSFGGVADDAALARAIVLEGEPGDVIYWPSGYWHVGDSTGDLALSLHLGLFFDAVPHQDVLRAVDRLIAPGLDDADRGLATLPFDLDRPGGDAAGGALPPALERAIARVRAAAPDRALDDAVRLSWLVKVSAFGFAAVPPPRSPAERLEDGATVRGDPRYPALLVPWTGGRLACAVCGRAFVVTAHAAVAAVVARLNAGRPASVGALVDECAQDGDVDARALVRMVVEKLWTLGALETEPPSRSDLLDLLD